MSEWTKEPWEVEPEETEEEDVIKGCDITAQGKSIFTVEIDNYCALNEANASRIVQCVNACVGLEDPAAELKRLREVEKVAMDMLSVCVKTVEWFVVYHEHNPAMVDDLEEIIEKASPLLHPEPKREES